MHLRLMPLLIMKTLVKSSQLYLTLYSAQIIIVTTSNNTKLVQWPLMRELLRYTIRYDTIVCI